MFQVVEIDTALATNSVADGDSVDLSTLIQAGPSFPNIGANAVIKIEIAPGATPGAYDIEVQQSNDDSTFTTLVAIDENTVGTTIYRNVTVTGRYLRLTVEEATANAGTVSAWLFSA